MRQGKKVEGNRVNMRKQSDPQSLNIEYSLVISRTMSRPYQNTDDLGNLQQSEDAEGVIGPRSSLLGLDLPLSLHPEPI